MTFDDAIKVAAYAASQQGVAMEVWEHTGGRTPKGEQVAQGRFVFKRVDQPPPRWAVWTLRGTIRPPKGAKKLKTDQTITVRQHVLDRPSDRARGRKASRLPL